MAKTKISIKKKRAITRLLSYFLSAIAFLLIFFELILTVHGNWDDLNYTMIFAAPAVAASSMIVAVVNIVKYRAHSSGLVPALSMVAVSALFFCYVMLYTSTQVLNY
jgi:hypothetical protein